MALLYKTAMFLSETRSFIFVTNRPLSEWDKMGVDTHRNYIPSEDHGWRTTNTLVITANAIYTPAKWKTKNLETHDSHQLTNFTSVSENIYIYFREGGVKSPVPTPVKRARSIAQKIAKSSVKTFWLIPSSDLCNSLNLQGRTRRLRIIRSFHLLPISCTVVATGQSGNSAFVFI